MVSSDKMSHSLHRTQKEIGCEFCSLDENPGIRKVFGGVNGREVFIWGMAPGRKENKEGREFVGESGELLWKELGLVGIKRTNCDIQNVVRCFPTKIDRWPELKMRNPCEEEIRCCSKYTEIAIKKSKAKLHIIFGKIAGKALLHDEYRKGELFRSETLKSQVLCMWHPSYLVRNGCSAARTHKSKEKLKRWQQDFKVAKNFLGRKEHGLESADQVL